MASPSPGPPTLAEIEALLNGPALAPPPGVEPNFVDPYSLGPVGKDLAITCVVLTTIFLFLRVYNKIFIIRRFGWDDYTAILGWAFFMAFIGVSLQLTKYGAGIHQWNVQAKELSTFLYWVNITGILYCFVCWILKFSILLQYLKIFAPTSTSTTFRFCCYVTIYSTLVFWTVNLFIQIFQCGSDREKIWDLMYQMEGAQGCIDELALDVVCGAVNCVTDFVLLLLPQTVIWKINMSLKRRLAVSVVFLVAALACAMSAIRLYYSVNMIQSSDVTYATLQMGLCMYADFAIVLIVGCVPSLPGLFKTGCASLRSKGGSSIQKLFRPFRSTELSNELPSMHKIDRSGSTGMSSKRVYPHGKREYSELDEERELESLSKGRSLNSETFIMTNSRDYPSHDEGRDATLGYPETRRNELEM